ncbi:hypothetical protein TCAL_07463, partial [Tigriopus californicus]
MIFPLSLCMAIKAEGSESKFTNPYDAGSPLEALPRTIIIIIIMGNAVGTHDTRKPDDEPVDVLKNSLDWINTHIEFATHASGGYGPWEFYAQMKGFLPIPEPKGDFRYRYSSCLELEADDDPTYLRETSGLLSTRSGGRNSQPELEYLECLEYFGANRGKTMCHDYAMDMRESYVMKRQ